MNTTVRSVDLAAIQRLEQETTRFVARLDFARRAAQRLADTNLPGAAELVEHLALATDNTKLLGSPMAIHYHAVRVLRAADFRQGAK